MGNSGDDRPGAVLMESSRTHARHRLDSTIHSPIRFSIMAALMEVDEAEFRRLRDVLELTDPALSKQASTLEKAGFPEPG